MGTRFFLFVVGLGLCAGLALGVLAASSFAAPANPVVPQSLQLDPPAQDDYIIMVAEAYAGDRNLQLAKDRLARLGDREVAKRVEKLATEYYGQRDLIATHLAILSVALGSRNRNLVALSKSPTPSAPPTSRSTLQNVSADAPPDEPIDAPTTTAEPVYVVVPNDNPYIILPTNTFTPSPTRRPMTRTPTHTPTPTATPTAAPPPPPLFEPAFPSAWPPGIYYIPANVEPGQKYWRLVHAVYCDFTEDNFGCPDRPGNRSGTSIYVMNGGAPIDVIDPSGRNVGGDTSVVGDLKLPGDMCECSWTFLVSDYRISVAGAPSDAIGGFSLYTVNGNVLAGHAHVRYFLYFDYVTR